MARLSQHNLSLIFHHFIPPWWGHVVSHHGSCHFSHRKKITTGKLLENFHYFWHSIFCWRIWSGLVSGSQQGILFLWLCHECLVLGIPTSSRHWVAGSKGWLKGIVWSMKTMFLILEKLQFALDAKDCFYKVVVCNDPFVLYFYFLTPHWPPKKKHHRRFWVVAWLHPHLPTAPTEKMGLRFLCGRFWGCVSIDPRSSCHWNRWHVGVLVGYCNRRIGAKDLSIEPWMQNPYILGPRNSINLQNQNGGDLVCQKLSPKKDLVFDWVASYANR